MIYQPVTPVTYLNIPMIIPLPKMFLMSMTSNDSTAAYLRFPCTSRFKAENIWNFSDVFSLSPLASLTKRSVQSKILKNVDSMKYLGVIIDRNHKRTSHISTWVRNLHESSFQISWPYITEWKKSSSASCLLMYSFSPFYWYPISFAGVIRTQLSPPPGDCKP